MTLKVFIVKKQKQQKQPNKKKKRLFAFQLDLILVFLSTAPILCFVLNVFLYLPRV